MRSWLIEHGYLRSDAQKTRDELMKMMEDKYTDVSSRTAAYLTWPDARLRAYLPRERHLRRQALNHPPWPSPGGAHPLDTSQLARWVALAPRGGRLRLWC